MHYFGVDALFVFSAVIYSATAIYAIYRMRNRAPPPDEERVAFMDSIRLAKTVSSVNPLSEVAGETTNSPPRDAEADRNSEDAPNTTS